MTCKAISSLHLSTAFPFLKKTKAVSETSQAFVFFRGGKAVDKCSDEMALQVKLAKATRVVKRREAWGAGLLARD